MIGKLLLGIGVLAGAALATASFSYSQMVSFTRSTVSYLNNFQTVESTCLASGSIIQLQGTVNGVCSTADTINYFEVQQEPTQVANLFQYGGSMLGIMASSITTGCNSNGIKTILQEKSTELSNWAGQIKSGAPVSLSQVSVVNGLKAMVANLEFGLISSAGYDLGETIQYYM